MLNIKKITLRELRLPLKEPFKISSGVETVRRVGLVEMEDVDGVRGWGECVGMEQPNYSPETLDTAWFAIKSWIAPRVLGRTFIGPEVLFPYLQKDIRGHLMAKAAIEMTVWELAARKEGVPLAQRLGGTRARIETGISIGIQPSVDALVRKVGACLDQGYPRIKLKIKPGADVDLVRAVRAAHGDGFALSVDANSAYTLADRDHLQQLDEFGLMMIEQPLGWDDLVRHAELQRHVQTALCLDESITGVERAQDMITLGSGRIVNIKPGRVGGFTSALAIHDLCQAHGVDVWCGGMLESGVGRAHNVALASLPGFTLPGDLSPSRRYWAQDIVTPEWTMDGEGRVTVPLDRPGMGVGLNREHIEDLTVRREVLT